MDKHVAIELYLSGMITACCWIAAMLFLRFWRETGDRLLLLFAVAFFTFGLTRMRAFLPAGSGWGIYPYVVRLITFAIILAAIVDKNIRSKRSREPGFRKT